MLILLDSFRSARNVLTKVHPLYWILAVVFAVLLAGILFTLWQSNQQFTTLSQKITLLESRIASTTTLLKENILETQSEIDETKESLSGELAQERQNVASLQEKLGGFQQEVGTITGTVTNLQKLSETDPELLQKYSKVFFLNEHYAPERTALIPNKYDYYEDRNHLIHAGAYPYLEDMLEAAEADGIDLYVYSAYRPFEEQRALKGQYTTVYGEGTANQFSADQGYSEHQLGTTVDLITTGIGGTLEGFETTEAYQWLLDNGHRFGFTLSYPAGNEYYVFEPWHWRFVGTAPATHLHETGQHFYEVEQRKIDEYLISIFD